MTQVFDVRDFGATGNGTTDDIIAINHAIAAAKADGGGIVLFTRGVYRVTSTILIQGNHITLRGVGAGIDANIAHGGGDVNTVIASAPSRILWSGATGGTVLKLDVGQLPNLTWVNHMGARIEDLVLDGNSTANVTFLDLSHCRMRVYRVTCVRYKKYGFSLGITNNANIIDKSSGDNYFEDCVATNLGTSIVNDTAMVCWGDSVQGNFCLSTFVRCSWFNNPSSTPAVSIECTDSLTFSGCRWGNGTLALHADGTSSSGLNNSFTQARTCVFNGCQGPITAKASTTGGNHAAGHIVNGYMMENINMYPVIETAPGGGGADLTVQTTMTPTPPPIGGSGAVVYGRSFAGTLAANTANQPIPHATNTTLQWSGVIWDALGAYEGGTSFTVPGGIKWLRAHLQVQWTNNTVGLRRFYLTRAKPGQPEFTWSIHEYLSTGDSYQNFSTAMLQVDAGDIIKVYAYQTSGTTISLLHNSGISPILMIEFQ